MKIRVICECGQDYELDKPRGELNLSLLLGNAVCPKCGRKRIERPIFEGVPTCAVCPLPVFPGKGRHGLCFMHYQQLRRKGLIQVRGYHRTERTIVRVGNTEAELTITENVTSEAKLIP